MLIFCDGGQCETKIKDYDGDRSGCDVCADFFSGIL